jgi:hypothetical protein
MPVGFSRSGIRSMNNLPVGFRTTSRLPDAVEIVTGTDPESIARLTLSQHNSQLFLPQPVPRQLILRMAAVVNPARKERAQVFARRFLERRAQVFCARRRVLVRLVVVL